MFKSLKDFLRVEKPAEKIEAICRVSGDAGQLNKILSRHEEINVNLLFFNGLSPLHLAALSGHTTVCELLIFGGAHANPSIKSDQNGATPIHLAAWHGSLDVCSLLVEKAGVPIDEVSQDGFSALHYACWGGVLSAVKYLLKRGASVTLKNTDGYTPLILASRCGKTEIVEYLLDNTASVLNEVDLQGCTSLHHACWDGHREVVRLLLTAGAIVTKPDNLGRRPVDLCKTRDIKELVQSVGLKVRSKRSPTHSSSSPTSSSSPPPSPFTRPENLSALQTAFSAIRPASPASPSSTRSHEAAGAAQTGEANVQGSGTPNIPKVTSTSSTPRVRVQAFLRMLGGHSSDPSIPVDTEPASPDQTNQEAQDKTVSIPRPPSPFSPIQNLIWRDADLESVHSEESRDTADAEARAAAVNGAFIPASVIQECWKICAGTGNAKSLYRLLRAYPALGDALEGCPLSNMRDADGFTPLMRAAERGYGDTLKLLLIAGCSVSMIDTHGNSALHHAAAAGRDECLVLLLQQHKRGSSRSSSPSSSPLSPKGESSSKKRLSVPVSPRSLTFAQSFDGCSPGQNTTESSPMAAVSSSELLSVDHQNFNEETALSRAASHGHLQCVIHLVAAGSSVNLQDKLGWIPLHHACYHNHARTVTYLMSRAPQSPLAITRNSETPADLTKDSNIKRALKAQSFYNMIPALQIIQKKEAEKELRRAIQIANNESFVGVEYDELVPVPVSVPAPVPVLVSRQNPRSAIKKSSKEGKGALETSVPSERLAAPNQFQEDSEVAVPVSSASKHTALQKIMGLLPATVSASKNTAVRAGSAQKEMAILPNAAAATNAQPTPQKVNLSLATSPVDAGDVLSALKSRSSQQQAKRTPGAAKGAAPSANATNAASAANVDPSTSTGAAVFSALSRGKAAIETPAAPAQPHLLSPAGTTTGTSALLQGDATIAAKGATRSSAELIQSLRDRLKHSTDPQRTSTPLQAKLAALKVEQQSREGAGAGKQKEAGVGFDGRSEVTAPTDANSTLSGTTGASVTSAGIEIDVDFAADAGGDGHEEEEEYTDEDEEGERHPLGRHLTPARRRHNRHSLPILSGSLRGHDVKLGDGTKRATQQDVFLFTLVLTQVFSAYSNSLSRAFYRWKHKGFGLASTPGRMTPGSTRKDKEGKRVKFPIQAPVASPRVFKFENY